MTGSELHDLVASLWEVCPGCSPKNLIWTEQGWFLDPWPCRESEAADLILCAIVRDGNPIARGPAGETMSVYSDWASAVLSMDLHRIVAARLRLAELEAAK